MKKKDSAGLGMTIPKRVRLAGMTFYLRNGQVVGRESSTHEKRSNTLPQFIQRQKMRHTTALWKTLRFCDVMFTERRTAYQNFASLANQLPAVYVTKRLMDQSSFLMPGIPVSDGILPTVKQELAEESSTAKGIHKHPRVECLSDERQEQREPPSSLGWPSRVWRRQSQVQAMCPRLPDATHTLRLSRRGHRLSASRLP